MPSEAFKSASAEADPVTPSAVREHLKKLLSHPDFVASPQLSSFLTYVVECKLEGAEERIKAYSIATEALGRPASFDPQGRPDRARAGEASAPGLAGLLQLRLRRSGDAH